MGPSAARQVDDRHGREGLRRHAVRLAVLARRSRARSSVTIVAIIAQLLFGKRALDVRRRPALGDREPQRRAVAARRCSTSTWSSGWSWGSCSCCWTGDGSTGDRHPNRNPDSIGTGRRTGTDLGSGDPARVVARRARSVVAFPLWRPWRFAAGVALGAAFSVKWSGAMASGRRADPVVRVGDDRADDGGDVSLGRAFARAIRQESLGLLIAFVAAAVRRLPASSYLPWFNHFGWSLKDWWENQTAMSAYHRSLQTTALDVATEHVHADASLLLACVDVALHVATGQLLLARRRARTSRRSSRSGTPRSSGRASGRSRSSSLMWRRRGDWRAGFVVTAVPGAVPPVVRWSRRPQFFFYVAPITPFMVLAIAYALRDLAAPRSSFANPTGAPSSPRAIPTCRSSGATWLLAVVAVPVVLAGAHRQPDLADRVAGAGLVPRLGLI